MYHADRDKEKRDLHGGKRQVFVEWEDQIQPKIELNHATVESCRIKYGSKERDNKIISVDISVRGQLLARDRKAPRKSSEARKKKIGIQEGDIRR